MVAESDEETRMLIRSLLELLGFVVVNVLTEQDVYESAVFYRPDLILIELTPPIVNRFSAIRRLKQDTEFKKVPIIAISSTTRVANEQLAFAAGCSAHVQKPIEFDQLGNLVESLIPCERLSLVSLLVH